MIKNYNGYLPLKKLLGDPNNPAPLKDKIHHFIKHQDCLIKGQANIRKLNDFLRSSKIVTSKTLDFELNHIYVLDTHALLIFTYDAMTYNEKGPKINFIYNNEFDIEICDAFKHKKVCLNIDDLYYAYDFINRKIDLIVDYFSTVDITHPMSTNPFTNKFLRNIVHYDAKTFISPHGDTPHSNINYVNILSENLRELNDFCLKHYYLEDINLKVKLNKNPLDAVYVDILIHRGTFNAVAHWNNSPLSIFRDFPLASNAKDHTYFQYRHTRSEGVLSDYYMYTKSLFETYDLKDKIHKELEKLSKKLKLDEINAF